MYFSTEGRVQTYTATIVFRHALLQHYRLVAIVRVVACTETCAVGCLVDEVGIRWHAPHPAVSRCGATGRNPHTLYTANAKAGLNASSPNEGNSRMHSSWSLRERAHWTTDSLLAQESLGRRHTHRLAQIDNVHIMHAMPCQSLPTCNLINFCHRRRSGGSAKNRPASNDFFSLQRMVCVALLVRTDATRFKEGRFLRREGD